MATERKGLRLSMWLLIIAAAMIGLIVLFYVGSFIAVWTLDDL